MSNRYLILLIFVWMPFVLIGGTALGDHYVEEFRALSGAGQMAVFYIYMLISTAPFLWGAFRPRK